jgi:signal transduction histidine kinase
MKVFWQIPNVTFPPANTLLLTVLFIALVEIATVYFKLQQPWTGIQLAVDAGHLVVTAVDAQSRAAGNIAINDIVVGIAQHEHVISLPTLLKIEPLSIGTHADFKRFMHLQTQLDTVLRSGKPFLLLTDIGKKIPVLPQPDTRLSNIPTIFWWLLLANSIGLLLGVIVWTYKPYTLEATALLLASISYFCANTLFRLLITREFHLPPDLMAGLISLEGGFFYLFMGSLLTILCYYPNRIAPSWVLPVTALTMLFLSINYHLQWLELPIHDYILPIIPLMLYATWLFYRQWQISAGNPINRTTVLVLQLSTLLPAWLVMLLYVTPIILGAPTLIGDIANRLLVISMFVGWAIGILRFRLFDMEYWWFKSLLWIIGGSLVIVLDLLLMSAFQASTQYALGLAVIMAGFLYFPLRQWLLGKIIPSERQQLQDFLPTFSAGMADATSKEIFEARWQTLLHQRFNPLHLECVEINMTRTLLSDNGLHLTIPSLSNHHAYRLSGKWQAARLFNQTDVQHTESLLMIARMASNANETRLLAITAERRRIMNDLHDSVGAQLLTLMHKLPNPEHRQAARMALTTLRETVRLSQKICPLKLVEHAADWRAEIAERADAAGVELVWQQGELNGYRLTPKQVLELSQVIREAVSNALKHAAPNHLEIWLKVVDDLLHLRISNDGTFRPLVEWQQGTGIRSMQHRVTTALQGSLRLLEQTTPPQISVLLTIPMEEDGHNITNPPKFY